jgi:hypothetical protein
MKEIRHRVRQRFDQSQRAGNADAARQQVGDGERDAEVQHRNAGGFREVQSKWHAHGRLLSKLAETVVTVPGGVHLIVPIAAIGAR